MVSSSCKCCSRVREFECVTFFLYLIVWCDFLTVDMVHGSPFGGDSTLPISHDDAMVNAMHQRSTSACQQKKNI
jgi:hypothetical protein